MAVPTSQQRPAKLRIYPRVLCACGCKSEAQALPDLAVQADEEVLRRDVAVQEGPRVQALDEAEELQRAHQHRLQVEVLPAVLEEVRQRGAYV